MCKKRSHSFSQVKDLSKASTCEEWSMCKFVRTLITIADGCMLPRSNALGFEEWWESHSRPSSCIVKIKLSWPLVNCKICLKPAGLHVFWLLVVLCRFDKHLNVQSLTEQENMWQDSVVPYELFPDWSLVWSIYTHRFGRNSPLSSLYLACARLSLLTKFFCLCFEIKSNGKLQNNLICWGSVY